MTVEFALDYIPRRMRELGYDNNYIPRLRHLQLDGNSQLTIESDNEYYYLINPTAEIEVRSKTGTFDLTDHTINEMRYEHKGKIEVRNKTDVSGFVFFIQVIPNHFK